MKHQGLATVFMVVMALFLFACSPSEDPIQDDTVVIPELDDGDTVQFTLIQTTDVHHHVVGTGPSATYGTDSDSTEGGYSRIARAIATIRATKKARGIPTVLVDSGDYFMGTVYDMSLGESPAALNFFETMNYDAITIGNHELDYGPAALGGFYYLALGEYLSIGVSKFNVPVVASNMLTDQAEGTDDDYLEGLYLAGVIKGSQIITLSNGLKVGILGFLGESAEADAPLADPLEFINDLTSADVNARLGMTEAAYIQSVVNTLRAQVDVVIALSHSGIINPNSGDPSGDDMTLAETISGIDIIASGHWHQMTDDVIVDPVNGTRIICAGSYGENVAQLDVTVTVGTGVTAATLENNGIDSDLVEYGPVQIYLVGQLDAGINDALVENGLPEVNDILALTDSDNLALPEEPGETGIGNLASDSLRALLGGQSLAMSIVANGVIRNGYAQGQYISFADIYNALPLGMTPDEDNQTIPGYPLLMLYFDSTSIRSLCQLSAFVIAAQGNPALSALKSDYYLNFSGIQYSYGSMFYDVDASDINLYGATDFTCSSAPYAPLAAIGPAHIPCVVDLYTALVFLSDDMQTLITGLNGYIAYVNATYGQTIPYIVIEPKINVGTLIAPDYVDLTEEYVLDDHVRLDMYSGVDGVQEVKEWMALYQFIQNLPQVPDSTLYLIPDAVYGSDALGSVNASRVNAQ